MTDIIHRLAQWAENDMRAEDIALAAKHEIQNLRAAVAMELLERENQEDLNDILADEVTRLRAENERLRETLARMKRFVTPMARGYIDAALEGPQNHMSKPLEVTHDPT
jgi:hypothetical protein